MYDVLCLEVEYEERTVCSHRWASGRLIPVRSGREGGCVSFPDRQYHRPCFRWRWNRSSRQGHAECPSGESVNSEYGTITVAADAPYDTLPEFIEYCKAHPGEVSFGNSGIGGIWHFVAAAFAQEAGIEITHVPFEGGGTAVTALAGGHVDAVPVTYTEVEVQVEAGRAKVLAVLAPERLPNLPDVPTAAEYGLDNLVFTIWRGFGVPLETPQEIVDRLAEAFQAALDDEEVTAFMEQRGYTKDYRDGQGLYDLMAREEASYAEQAVALGLKN